MADQPEGVPTARDVLDTADRYQLAGQSDLAMINIIHASRLLDARLSALADRAAPACEQCATIRRDFDARGVELDQMIRAYEGKVAEVERLTAALAEAERHRDACNGSCDIALARRHVGPDGIVPGNARECAELWEREAARLRNERDHEHSIYLAAEQRARDAEAERDRLRADLARLTAAGPATDEELRRVEERVRRDVAESGRAAGVSAQMIAVHAAPAVRRALYEHGRTAPAPGREERPTPSTPPRAEAPTVEQTFRVERVADDNGNISVRATVASQRAITRTPPRAEAPAPGAGEPWRWVTLNDDGSLGALWGPRPPWTGKPEHLFPVYRHAAPTPGAGLTVERPPFGYVVHYGGGRWKMTVLNRQDAEEEAECSPGAEAVPLYRHAAPTPGAGLTVGEPVWTPDDAKGGPQAAVGKVLLHAYKTHGSAPQPAAWVALVDNRSVGMGQAPDLATAKRAAYAFALSLNGATPAPRGLTVDMVTAAYASLRGTSWDNDTVAADLFAALTAAGPCALPPVDVAARLADALVDSVPIDAQRFLSRDRRIAGLTVELRRVLTSLGAPAGTPDDAVRSAEAFIARKRAIGYDAAALAVLDELLVTLRANAERGGRATTPVAGAPAGTGGGRGEAWGQETRRLLLVALMAAFFDGSQVGADPCTRDAAEAALLRHLGITPSPPTHPPVGEGEGRV